MIIDLLLSGDGIGALIEQYDKQLLLAVNGSDSLYLDRVVRTLTNALTWVPFYISLLWLVIRTSETMRRVLYVLLGAAICVTLAGMVDDLIVKPTVARWRPTHDPEIGMLVDIVDGYRGGRYGFFSAHAANTFSIAVFFCWLVRSRVLSVAAVIWSLINCSPSPIMSTTASRVIWWSARHVFSHRITPLRASIRRMSTRPSAS